MSQTEENHARDKARAQLESIKEMVAALHVDYDRLEDLMALDAKEMPAELVEEMGPLLHYANNCRSREEAEQTIQEDPLSVEVRTGWYSPNGDGQTRGPEEFQILLCTGGPAVRIIGDLDELLNPQFPRIQYQDWGTPWTNYPLTSDEDAAVTEYCKQFYFGG